MGCASSAFAPAREPTSPTRARRRSFDETSAILTAPSPPPPVRRNSFVSNDINDVVSAHNRRPPSTEAQISQSQQLDDLKVLGLLGVGSLGRVRLVQHGSATYALKAMSKGKLLLNSQLKHVLSERWVLQHVSKVRRHT
jgi:hypothetical protein